MACKDESSLFFYEVMDATTETARNTDICAATSMDIYMGSIAGSIASSVALINAATSAVTGRESGRADSHRHVPALLAAQRTTLIFLILFFSLTILRGHLCGYFGIPL